LEIIILINYKNTRTDNATPHRCMTRTTHNSCNANGLSTNSAFSWSGFNVPLDTLWVIFWASLSTSAKHPAALSINRTKRN